MPGMLLTTAAGLDEHDYDMLVFRTPTIPVSGEPAVNSAWQEVMDQAQHPLRLGLASLAKAGAALPEVGMELVDDKGRVVADAELTWVKRRVVVLRADQSDLAEVWHAQTWVICQLDESSTLIEDQPWASAVATILGLEMGKE